MRTPLLLLTLGLLASSSATAGTSAATLSLSSRRLGEAGRLLQATAPDATAATAATAMPLPLTLLLQTPPLHLHHLHKQQELTQAPAAQTQDPDGGRGMEGKKDPPPRFLQGRQDPGRMRASVPSSHHQKLVHEMLAALFLALGVVVLGLLGCCVVRCDASRVFPCLAGRRRTASVADEDTVDIEESPGDKAADWQARVGQPEAEEEGKQEGKDGVLASGVAAPALLQAASTIWSVSSSALLGLFGMGNSSSDVAGEGGEEQSAAAKAQRLEAAEMKQQELAAQPPQ